MRSALSRVFVVALAAFAIGVAATAEAGTLSGHVKDQNGVPIVGATVEILHPDTFETVGIDTSDANGAYSIAVDDGTYAAFVTPPPSSDIPPVFLENIVVAGATTFDFVLQSPNATIFSGRILDRTGAPVQGQSVLLIRTGSETGVSATTDAAGEFSLNTQTGSHFLLVSGSNPGTLEVPQFYAVQTNTFDITGNTTTDFTLPVKRVTVHVQNGTSPIAGANVSSTSALNCELVFGSAGACGASYYDAATTDASGNAVLFLFETSASNPDSRYSFTAVPPISSGLAAGSLSGVEVTADTTVTIELAAPTVLTGTLLDGAGVGIANQQLELVADGLEAGVSATTGAGGAFMFSVEPGIYRLNVFGGNEGSTAGVSGSYSLNSGPFTISSSQTTDFQLPFKLVDVNVTSNGGGPVADVLLTTTAVSNCGLIFGPTTACGASSYSSADAATTDAAGTVALWLFPTPPPNPGQVTSYRFTATPPNGSGHATTTKSNITFAGNTTETIVLAASVTVTGSIFDRLNNGVPNQLVEFVSDDSSVTSDTTDATGSYSVSIQEGTYRINVVGDNQDFTRATPQSYGVTTEPINVTGNQVINLAIPAMRLNVHVQDAGNNPIANVGLTAVGPINCALTVGPTTACGLSQYFYNLPGPGEPAPAFGVTDASGDLTLWLFATPAGDTYDLTATPLADSGFNATNITGQALTVDNTTLVIVLNAAHAAPVTTLNISPAAQPDGSYPDPATITLSATAAPGFNVETTFYDLDNTGMLQYIGPFNVTGVGPHTIRYFSVDDEGVAETPKTFDFTLSEPDNVAPVTTASLSAAPNAAGWHKQDVTVTLTAVDEPGGSGVNSITYSIAGAQAGPAVVTSSNIVSVTITQEGTSAITFWASDNAGNNEVPQTIVVRLDKTAPTINGSASPAPNASGWNNTPVTVSFTCSDAPSGLAPGSPPSPTTLSSEGAGQSVTGTCFDIAGNSASTTVSNINIDLTAPEAYTQFDVASKDVFVFGRDSVSGVTGLPVTPSSVVLVAPFDQQRTYNVTDAGGNVMQLVLRVFKVGHLVTARVVSTKYGAADATPAPVNLETYTWTVRPNGSLGTLDQLLTVPGSLVQANFNWLQNKTTIHKLLPLPVTQQIVNGVALLRLATLQGNLQIEY